MYRDVSPVANRRCAAAWRQRQHQGHKKRMEQNPPRIDMAPPKTYFLNVNRAKREQMTDEQCNKIDRENKLLLSKMKEIMATNTLDFANRPTYVQSLNGGQRRREFARIVGENASLLHRLQTLRPVHSRREWDAHEQRHAAYLEGMREKPMPPDPIPLPRFLRGPGSVTERRPPHAYVQGNYTALLRAGAETARQGSSDGSQSARLASDRSHSSRWAQTAPPTASIPSASSYALHSPRPQRTGVSKTHSSPSSSSARVHQLQPLPPPKVAPSSSSVTPSKPSARSNPNPTPSPRRAAAQRTTILARPNPKPQDRKSVV